MVQEAEQILAAYGKGRAGATNVLRVVYFVPKDGEPFPDYEARLDRIVTDVANFYHEGFVRLGIQASVPLERKDGKLAVHLVRGKLPSREYHYDSGGSTALEIASALKGTMDVEREHVLVFYALCRKSDDGTHVFDSPYYGGGSQRGGMCHAADCELLDPLLLTDTNRTMVISEHYYKSLKITVAKFNSMYLGGIAHELGHALGLPHDNGGAAEKAFGVSLMGVGNLTYREELWNGGEPTYLGRASILQLLSNPLISGTDRGRWKDAESTFKSLKFFASNDAVSIHGTVAGSIPPYAVIAYVWPEDSEIDDHWARTFPCVPNNGAFALDVDGIRAGRWRQFHLKLARLQVNGAAAEEQFHLSFDAQGKAEVAALNDEWIVSQAERAVMQGKAQARAFLNDTSATAVSTLEASQKLRVLRAAIRPPTPVKLRAVRTNQVFLSDVSWASAKVGWGRVARNHYWFDHGIQDGVFLMLNGRFYEKGLYAHSPSRYVFAVDRRWEQFTALVGLRDGAAQQGSAIFTVRGDGKELYRSRLLRAGEQESVNVSIANVKKLELLTDGGEGHNYNSWAIWVNPEVLRQAQ